jgi:serine/threonine protein kinase
LTRPYSKQQETGSTLIRASELEYRRDDEIARGNYGTVYKGRCRGFPVAIKVLHNQQLTQQKIEELKREVEIMKYVSSAAVYRKWLRFALALEFGRPI